MFKVSNKKLDLLAAYYRKEGPSSFEKYIRIFGIPTVLIVVLLAFYGFMYFSNSSLEDKINEVKQDTQVIQDKIDNSDQSAYKELTTLQNTYDSIKKTDEYISKLPRITKRKIESLRDSLLSNMSIDSLTYEQTSGQVSMSCRSSNVRNIEKYITILKKNKLYSNIIYKGYQQTTQTNTIHTGQYDELTGQEITTQSSTSYYTFNVVVVIAGGK